MGLPVRTRKITLLQDLWLPVRLSPLGTLMRQRMLGAAVHLSRKTTSLGL
jgi:hypothetical protein